MALESVIAKHYIIPTCGVPLAESISKRRERNISERGLHLLYA